VNKVRRARSRNEDEKLQRHEAILSAAEKVFFNRGLEKTTMDHIAKAAGLSRSLLYVYFDDKDDIHTALCSRALDSLYQRKLAAYAECRTGAEKVRAGGLAYYRFYLEEPDSFKTLCLRMSLAGETRSTHQQIKPAQQKTQQQEEKIMSLMESAIMQGIEDGSIIKSKVSDPLQTALYLRGALHGIIMLQDASGSQIFDTAGLERDALIRYGIDTLASTLLDT